MPVISYRFVQRLYSNQSLSVSEQSEMVQDFYGVSDISNSQWITKVQFSKKINDLSID